MWGNIWLTKLMLFLCMTSWIYIYFLVCFNVPNFGSHATRLDGIVLNVVASTVDIILLFCVPVSFLHITNSGHLYQYKAILFSGQSLNSGQVVHGRKSSKCLPARDNSGRVPFWTISSRLSIG